MADNFLEKRMDDYRGVLNLKFPSGRVLILGADCPTGQALIRCYVDAGWSVVFTANNPADGTHTAQNYGGRFYPLSLSEIATDLEQKGEAVDVLVALGTMPIEFPMEVRRKILITSEETSPQPNLATIHGNSPAQAAMLAIILSHPTTPVKGQVIRL